MYRVHRLTLRLQEFTPTPLLRSRSTHRARTIRPRFYQSIAHPCPWLPFRFKCGPGWYLVFLLGAHHLICDSSRHTVTKNMPPARLWAHNITTRRGQSMMAFSIPLRGQSQATFRSTASTWLTMPCSSCRLSTGFSPRLGPDTWITIPPTVKVMKESR